MIKTFLRVFFSCLLSLFIAIGCLAGSACHFAATTVCDSAPMLRVAKTQGFTTQLYEEIVYDWENLLSITGVTEPESIMAVLTLELVERDALKYITDSYAGSATVTTEDLRSQLDQKVRDYAYSHNIHATPEAELEQNINDLVDACISDYTESIRIPLLPKLLSYASNLGSLFEKLIPLIAGGVGALLLFLLVLQKKRRDTLYYAAISSATGGIMLFAVTMLTQHYDILNRLPFSDSAVKTLVVSYLQMILNELNRYGIIFMLAAAILLVAYLMFCLFAKLFRKKTQTA